MGEGQSRGGSKWGGLSGGRKVLITLSGGGSKWEAHEGLSGGRVYVGV